MLLNCRCRCQSRHRSSHLDNVTEFPSLCTLLESKTQYTASPLENATSVCKHDICPSKCVRLTITPSCASFRASLRPNRKPHTLATTHQTFVVDTSTHISCSPSSIKHMSTSWFFHVSRETLHCFSEDNPVLSGIRQLHEAAVQIRLCWRGFLGALHLCCLFFISPDK